jgi:hypothetical protein
LQRTIQDNENAEGRVAQSEKKSKRRNRRRGPHGTLWKSQEMFHKTFIEEGWSPERIDHAEFGYRNEEDYQESLRDIRL